MKTHLLVTLLTVGVLGSGIGIIYATDPLAEKEASPTLKPP
jgi:hypothetical protein